MGFGLVQTGFLFGLLALLIPIIIHLVYRRRPRRVEIGSVRFLQQVLRRYRGRRKAMRWLLLALRMASLALLAILFARPFFSEWDRRSDRSVAAILIDRSASMQLQSDGRSLLDEATDRARELVRSAADTTQFEVAFFSHDVRPVSGVTVSANDAPDSEGVDTNRVRQIVTEMETPEVSFGATDYAAALRWARDVCMKAPATTKEVHLFTDMQRSGLDWSRVEPMPPNVTVRLYELGRALPNNVAITSATPSRLMTRPGESTNVNVSLLNAGPFTLEEVPVVLHVSNDTKTITRRQNIKLEPDAIVALDFDLPGLDQGIWKGTVSLETIDDLPFDNQRFLAMMVAPHYEVLVVDGDPHESQYLCETYFLESAIRLAPRGETYEDSPYSPTVIHRPEELPDLAKWDQLVLANVDDLDSGEVLRIERFVRSGGGVIVFTGERVNAQSLVGFVESGLTPGRVIGARTADDLAYRIRRWDSTTDVFEPFNEPEHGDLGRLRFWGHTAIEPDAESETLAWLGDDIPLVVRKPVGEGEVLWFLSAVDQQWGDWTRSHLFLPLVHQMLGHLTGLNEGGPVREFLIDTTRPDPSSESPGIINHSNRYWEVINVNPRESETVRCSVSDFVDRFEIAQTDSDQPAVAASLSPAAFEIRQNEMSHWVLFVLVALLSLEFLVANRTAA